VQTIFFERNYCKQLYEHINNITLSAEIRKDFLAELTKKCLMKSEVCCLCLWICIYDGPSRFVSTIDQHLCHQCNSIMFEYFIHPPLTIISKNLYFRFIQLMMYIILILVQIDHLMNEYKMLIFAYNSDVCIG